MISLPNAGSLLVNRLQRWPNMKPLLLHRPLFADLGGIIQLVTRIIARYYVLPVVR